MNSVIVGHFNTSVSTMDRSSRQRINNKTADLNNTIDQTNLTNINRTFYLTTAGYTFLSRVHRTLSRIKHMLAHKTIFRKFNKMKSYNYLL